MEVPPEKASAYGVLDVKEDMGDLVSTRGMVEKPSIDEAPSNLAVIGRYILTPDVLKSLDRKQTGAGGEIQLTDAIANELEQGRDVFGYRFRGQRFDCGSKAGFLQATVPSAWPETNCGTSLWAICTIWWPRTKLPSNTA